MFFPYLVFIFICFVSVQRVHETFFSKIRQQRIKGDVTAKWTIVPMTTIHVGTVLSSYVEYFVLMPRIFPLISLLGFFFYGIALFIRIWCMHIMGKYYSIDIELRTNQPLIMQGPYKVVRHPVYLVTLFELISVPLALNAYHSLLIPILGYYPFLFIRLCLEERALREKFGAEYEEYAKKVPALIPIPKSFFIGKKS